jgi:FAD/FMN-containing dehydrogenase
MSPHLDRLNNLPPEPRPSYDVSPRTFEALFAAVGTAASAGKTKALAGAWGFSLAGTTEGTRIRTKAYSGLGEPDCLRTGATSREFDADPLVPNEQPGPLLRVLAGTTFVNLNEQLRGLAVLNQPGFGDLTFGGVMMVGGHGSGLRRGNIASQVRSMDLIVVNAARQAELVRIEPRSDAITDPVAFAATYPQGRLLNVDDAVFNAAKVSFGCMGVLHSVTIDTRPEYRLEEDRDVRDLWGEFEKIERQVRDPEVAGVHLWINPYRVGGDYKAVQSTYRRSLDMKRNKRAWGILQADSPAATWGLNLVAKKLPRLLPLALEASLRTVDAADVVMASPEALDFGPPNRLPVAAASCSVPAEGLKETLEALLAHFEEGFGRTYVSSPIGLRWVRASDAYLAPQYGRDSVMIEVPVLNGTPHQDETLERYVEFMVTKLGARPHWGQRLHLSPVQLRRIYGDDAVDTFIRVRRQLDPLSVFDNPLTRMLGL